jgi:hypothetical protein
MVEAARKSLACQRAVFKNPGIATPEVRLMLGFDPWHHLESLAEKAFIRCVRTGSGAGRTHYTRWYPVTEEEELE